MHSTDSSLDLQLLRSIARRRKRVWIPIAAATLIACLGYGLFLLPQGYASRVSIAFPQSPSGNLLGGLIGLAGSNNTKYIGIVKSTRLAREVEAKAHVQQLLHLATRGDAIQKIKEGLTVDDNPRDGLLYITVQLPGPARFAPGAREQRDSVRQTVAVAADEYAEALRRYVAVSDVDKEAILLRVSEDRLRRERANYDRTVKKLIYFVRGSSGPAAADTSPQDTSTGAGGAGLMSRTQVTALEQLYSRRAQLEADIRSAAAAIQVGEEQQRDLVENLDSVPLEDPLLAETRTALRNRELELESLRIQFGPDHPSVVNAKQQVAILRKQFEQQRRAALSGRSSERATAEARLSALKAALGTVVQNISKAEHVAKLTRESQADYEILRNNVMIALETLKATATNVATLQLQTLSAKNRMTVVDDARPPANGSPGLGMILVGSLALTLAVIGSLAAIDYSRVVQARQTVDLSRAEVTV